MTPKVYIALAFAVVGFGLYAIRPISVTEFRTRSGTFEYATITGVKSGLEEVIDGASWSASRSFEDASYAPIPIPLGETSQVWLRLITPWRIDAEHFARYDREWRILYLVDPNDTDGIYGWKFKLPP